MNASKTKTIDESDGGVQEILHFLRDCADRTEHNIKRILAEYPRRTTDESLLEAVGYSVFNGGKRIRPGLVYATAQLLELERETVDPVACAVELIHCYSLIHDDLPAMDDDDVRRGKPACHKAFGEAVAILAGDAMQAMAFECLSKAPLIDDKIKNEVCLILARNAGIAGMASGQAMDVASNKNVPAAGQIEKIHRLKTGSLLAACVLMPLRCAPGTPKETAQNLSDYAANVGLCFQIRDDLLDAEQTGGDFEKPSYVAVHGKDLSREKLAQVSQRCLASLQPLGQNASLLKGITDYITNRGS